MSRNYTKCLTELYIIWLHEYKITIKAATSADVLFVGIRGKRRV